MCYAVWTFNTLHQQHAYLDLVPHEGFTGLRSHSDTGHLQDTWFIHLLASCFHTWTWGIQRDAFSSIKDSKQALLVSVSCQRLLKGIPKTRDSVTVWLFIMLPLEKAPMHEETIDDRVIIPVFHCFFTPKKVGVSQCYSMTSDLWM